MTLLRLLATLYIDVQLAHLAHRDGLFPIYPIWVGLVLLLHSFRSRTISCMGNTNLFGNTHARRVFLHMLLTCLLGAYSSSGTLYCQVQHPAGDVARIASLDMSKPTMQLVR